MSKPQPAQRLIDGADNVTLNGVTLPDGSRVSWAKAFPRLAPTTVTTDER